MYQRDSEHLDRQNLIIWQYRWTDRWTNRLFATLSAEHLWQAILKSFEWTQCYRANERKFGQWLLTFILETFWPLPWRRGSCLWQDYSVMNICVKLCENPIKHGRITECTWIVHEHQVIWQNRQIERQIVCLQHAASIWWAFVIRIFAKEFLKILWLNKTHSIHKLCLKGQKGPVDGVIAVCPPFGA